MVRHWLYVLYLITVKVEGKHHVHILVTKPFLFSSMTLRLEVMSTSKPVDPPRWGLCDVRGVLHNEAEAI